DASAIEYWLYSVDPYAVSWTLKAVEPIDRTATAFAALTAGAYQYRILARNAAGEFVAQSNDVTVALVAAPERQIFLPLIVQTP
ncbi:MAG: hypothetical protein M3Q45_09885, partial [Chloroflexota bacterium]|nr:hypothetical protein [Chloroflexota bacterium]